MRMRFRSKHEIKRAQILRLLNLRKLDMFSKQLIPSLALIGSSLADEILMNLIPGLVPPEGTIWRGATISSDGPLEGSWTYGTDPDVFEAYYN